MPRRRNDNLLNLLIGAPWYVGAVLGAGLWLSAPWIVGHFFSGAPTLAKSQDSFVGLVRLFSYVCVGAAAISLVRGALLRQKFAAQRSIDDLRALTWQQFESIVGEGFRRQGYSVTETGQGGADGGVDLVLMREGKLYLVQCKQYRASTVSVMTVREIFGVVAAQRAAGAIVVTTGAFTNEAIAFAKNQPIELIDGRRLEAMVREINQVTGTLPARVEPVVLEVASPIVAISCPKCGSPMVRRTARNGGAEFMGCSSFPKCRGTRSL